MISPPHYTIGVQKVLIGHFCPCDFCHIAIESVQKCTKAQVRAEFGEARTSKVMYVDTHTHTRCAFKNPGVQFMHLTLLLATLAPRFALGAGACLQLLALGLAFTLNSPALMHRPAPRAWRLNCKRNCTRLNKLLAPAHR